MSSMNNGWDRVIGFPNDNIPNNFKLGLFPNEQTNSSTLNPFANPVGFGSISQFDGGTR